MLRECLQSVVASEHRPVEIVVVDNSTSSRVAEFVAGWKAELTPADPELVFAPQAQNVGYAAATNRGVAVSSGELVLLLNPDAVVQPSTLSFLVGAAARRPQAIGFAPKIRLASHELIIDSIGIDLHLRGQGGQRGLGEPDIGQYDIEERVPGLCFAAALIRRSAFSPQVVGLLDERYFMFYEDVDWSMRAAMRGKEFWSVPSANVRHVHSASTRHLRHSFKDRLIQRNLMWTAAKNLERRRVGRVMLGLTVRNLVGGAVNRHFWTAARATAGAWAGLPQLATTRRDLQRTRSRSDHAVLSEPRSAQAFDTERYQPLPSATTLVSILSRWYAVSPDPILGDLVFRLTLAGQTSMAMDPARMAAMVRDSGVTIGPGLEWLLESLERGSAP
jgi:GT2 family glycosyltransferase